MTLDYFYGQAGELFSFYRIPKALFQEPRFQSLSTDAKTLYGILLDRMSLSAKNGWLDEQGRVFIIFTIEDVKRALCCADNKATKLLRELEEFGLIERKRRGLGKPSLVYRSSGRVGPAQCLRCQIRQVEHRLRQKFSLISDELLILSSASGYQLNPELHIMTDTKVTAHSESPPI